MKKIFFFSVLILFLVIPAAGFCQGPKVVVFPFKNNGQAQLSGLSSGLAAMFTTELSRSRGLEVVEPARVEAALGRTRLVGGAPTAEDALKAAAALGADFAVLGEYIGFGSRFRIDVRLYDAKTGALKVADKAQNREDAMFDMVDDLSGRLVVAITGAVPVVGGGLQVSSEPPGATLLVDGEHAGDTPRTITGLAPGQHRVEINLDGYQPFAQTVTVRANETAKVEAKLTRLLGGIRAWWKDYPTSDISISGEKTIPMGVFQTGVFQGGVNLTGKYCMNLPSGHYVVSVRLPSKDEGSWESRRAWRTYTADMDLQPGQVMDIFVNNNLFSPGLEVSPCGGCADGWDFTTKVSWFE